MSDPTAAWQRMFQQGHDSLRSVDRFLENVLAELHSAEYQRVSLAQQIIAIIHQADEQLNHSTESDWGGIFSNAFEDIEKLCREQLKGK